MKLPLHENSFVKATAPFLCSKIFMKIQKTPKKRQNQYFHEKNPVVHEIKVKKKNKICYHKIKDKTL